MLFLEVISHFLEIRNDFAKPNYISGGMLCQVICRGSVLGIVFLVQTSTADFKWLVPSIFGIMGLLSSVLVYRLPDRSTSPLLNTISNIKRLQITTIEKTIEKVTTDNKS